MNNYYINQIRRANCGLLKKAFGLLMGVLCPRRIERAWRRHANRLQQELDADHNGRRYTAPYLDLHPQLAWRRGR